MILLLAILVSLFPKNNLTEFSVEVKMFQPPTMHKVSFVVSTRNITDDTVKISINRRQDFKWYNIPGTFNYIVELQKFEGNSYQLFEPSADIDPTYEEERFTTLEKGAVITDTLVLHGISYSRSNKSPGTFPTGDYRLKVYFKKTWWASMAGESDWLKFSIK